MKLTMKEGWLTLDKVNNVYGQTTWEFTEEKPDYVSEKSKASSTSQAFSCPERKLGK